MQMTPDWEFFAIIELRLVPAPVVKWISRDASDVESRVQILAGAQIQFVFVIDNF